MPLIYDIFPLFNVERNVTLRHLMGEFSQTISCPIPHFPRIFLQVRVNDAVFRAEAFPEGQVFNHSIQPDRFTV